MKLSRTLFQVYVDWNRIVVIASIVQFSSTPRRSDGIEVVCKINKWQVFMLAWWSNVT